MSAPPSLRGRLRRAFAAAVVVAVALTIAGVVAVIGLLDARQRVIDRADPASLEAERLLGALVDQETGLRAFVITRSVLFLEPYERGVDAERVAYDELGRLLHGSPPALELVRAAQAAATRWHEEYATPTIDGTKAGSPGLDTTASLSLGRQLFDEVRVSIGDLQNDLSQQRSDARSDLSVATVRLLAALMVLALAMIAVVGILYAMVRRRVETPLGQLRSDARTVAGGDIEHTIAPVGLAEFQELSIALEQMRARLLADVLAVTEARDELERRSADLARSNAELEQFAYVASHDLQEPLRKVASFCQLLQQRYAGQLDERADQYIEFAVDGAKRMQILINDLLAFSRVGRSDRPAETLEASALVDAALANLTTLLEETDARVEVGPLPTVRIERALGIALFQNLIGNAIKFRQPGIAPVVAVGAVTTAGHHEFVIVDNGIGIDAEYAERVFVIFQRLHTKEAYPGTGIGLAMCRKIVEHHGGTIWVDPKVAVGATIRFTLPVVDPEEVQP